ncbi:hypothetical protein A9Q87_01845 [Flavobacteriales bacterium 34_180_T64]|nr:hypothetical protein A9Q87_01845 [Flavobacteriales bacterium 34_180_T64]
MKNYFLILSILLIYASCQKNKTVIKESKVSTVAEQIANAHGLSHWNKVSQIKFTFNVDRDSSHYERSWSWKPKTNDVSLITNTDTIKYNRTDIDSISINADKAFINDKYWLLVPFQLVWDESTTITEPVQTEAPISKKLLNKITLTYSNEGGYTPGDAYDIYYSDDFLIQEWVFRKANSKDATLTSTFENYQTFNGLKIALTHKKPERNWNLNFTDVIVTQD